MNEELLKTIMGYLSQIDMSTKIIVGYLMEKTGDDTPITNIIGVKQQEEIKREYAPRGRNKTYHPGLVGIDNLRQHYYMSEPYVVETCMKAGIHIEKIGKHWFVKKEDRRRVVEVCNLEPK